MVKDEQHVSGKIKWRWQAAVLLPFLFLFCLFLLVNCARVPHGLPPNILVEPEQPEALSPGGPDSVTVIATDYYKAGPWTRLAQGSNYRSAWAAPVKVKVMWLDSFQGELEIVDAGGGGQTHSLDLKDSTGVAYTLRSVTKDPGPSVPSWLWRWHLEDIVFDAASAGHPYGAIPAASLADAAGILHTHPRLVFLPHQRALGEFDDNFGGRLYLFEYEGEDESGIWTGLQGVEKVVDSDDAVEELIEHPDRRADQRSLLYARLFDLAVGDWDRHAGNWGWARVVTDTGKVYIPVATDRDNVFYKIGGILPWLLTRPVFNMQIRPFTRNIGYMRGLLKNGSKLNTFFLNRMERKDYQWAADRLQEKLTDERIAAAMRTLPDTIYKLNGKEIAQKIRQRRDDIDRYAMKFYGIMARAPEIHGSEKDDLFFITARKDGSIEVKVVSPVKNDSTGIVYRRSFYPDETRELRFFAWGGEDTFTLEGPGSPITLKIAGGEGSSFLRYVAGEEQVYSWDLQIRKREEWNRFPGEVRWYETTMEPRMPE